MSIRQSARIRGIPPEISVSETNIGRRRQREEYDLPTSVKKPAVASIMPTTVPPIPSTTDSFSFAPPGPRLVASDPVKGSEKVAVIPPQVVTDEEEVIPLTRTEILRILSREMPMDKASIIASISSKSNIINQKVPSIYSSYFFRKDILKEFQRKVLEKIPIDKRSSSPLSVYNLYNKDDLLNNTFYRPDRPGTRFTEKSSGYSSKSIDNMQKIIKLLANPPTKKDPNRVCVGIDTYYAKNSVEKAIDLVQNEDKFDILVASTRKLEDLSLPLEERISDIVAFIIVELGECEKYPGSYSINLICTNTKRAISGTGGILMGAFLYTILSHPPNPKPAVPIKFPVGNSFLQVTSKRLKDGSVIEKASFSTSERLIPLQQVAVLELALAYTNPGGLCMYEKFGFTYDQTMFSNPKAKPPIDCFSDRNNLPMLIDFNTKPGYAGLSQEDKKEKVLNITSGLDRGFPKSKICSIRDPDKQKLLGYLKTIKLYIDNEPGASLDDYLSTSDEGVILYQLKMIHAPELPSNVSRRNAPTPKREGTLEEFINYLENTPANPDAYMEKKIAKLIQFLPKDKKKGGRLSRKNKKIYNNYSRKMR
jgi:hypothetical protein